MNGLEKFDRKQLETWITMCDEKFDELGVTDNQGGALLSISGRLGNYVESNEETIAALRARVEKLEDALLISGNTLTDVKNFLEIEIKVCGGVGMEYELGLVESIDAFQDLHGEMVKELGEKHARGEV